MAAQLTPSFSSASEGELYSLLENRYGIDVVPFPRVVQARFGTQIRVRESDGRWIEEIAYDSPGRRTQYLRWSQHCHPHPLVEWMARSFALEGLERRATLVPTIAVLDALNHLDFPDDTDESACIKAMSIWAHTQIRKACEQKTSELYSGIRCFYQRFLEDDVLGFDELTWLSLNEATWGFPTREYTSVLMLNAQDGPYTAQELQAIDFAIDNKDSITDRDRALIGLCRDWGLRPMQHALLRTEDFIDGDESYINVTSVKGRHRSYIRRHPSNMKMRRISDRTAAAIRTHLATNEATLERLLVELEDMGFPDARQLPRAMFPIRQLFPARTARYSESPELRPWLLHQSHGISFDIRNLTDLLAIPNSRHTAAAPEADDELLEISATRFRRTLATSMVMNGSSREEVAEAMDHLHLSSVTPYFRFNRDTATALNEAYWKSPKHQSAVQHWTGRMTSEAEPSGPTQVVKSRKLTFLGLCMKQGECPYHPGVTCYACRSFRPDRNGDHETARDDIAEERQVYGSTSTGAFKTQLDESYTNSCAVVEAAKRLKKA